MGKEQKEVLIEAFLTDGFLTDLPAGRQETRKARK
jgi:hypothetical protein